VLGVVAVAVSGALTTKPMYVDVETRGELTRGMCVVDVRPERQAPPNVELAVDVDVPQVRKYIERMLQQLK
jgi:inosine-uridine nucleoside N-ribohydrolase